MKRVAAQAMLTAEQKAQLESYARGRKTAARLALRAGNDLMATEVRQDLGSQRR